MQFLKQDDLTIILSLKIQPAAKRTGIVGIYNQNALKIALQAPPIEGKANEALIRFLSKTAKIPQSHITLIQGGLSKEKKVRLDFSESSQKEAFIQYLREYLQEHLPDYLE